MQMHYSISSFGGDLGGFRNLGFLEIEREREEKKKGRRKRKGKEKRGGGLLLGRRDSLWCVATIEDEKVRKGSFFFVF